jgi:hypothetical protein
VSQLIALIDEHNNDADAVIGVIQAREESATVRAITVLCCCSHTTRRVVVTHSSEERRSVHRACECAHIKDTLARARVGDADIARWRQVETGALGRDCQAC